MADNVRVKDQTRRLVTPIVVLTVVSIVLIHIGLTTLGQTLTYTLQETGSRQLGPTFEHFLSEEVRAQHRGQRSAPIGRIGSDGRATGALSPTLTGFAQRAAARADEDLYFETVWNGDQAVLASADRSSTGDLILYADVLTPGPVDRFADRLGLKDFQFIPTSGGHRGEQILISDSRSPAAGALEWSPLVSSWSIMLPAIVGGWVMTMIFAWAGWRLCRQTIRLAQSLVASEEHAQHLALHDPLTGLANRILFSSRLELAIEQRRRSDGVVGVFAVDLDRFKQINDSLGHAAGDEMIRIAAQRLLSVCRTTDTVARLGGDELALVAQLPGVSAVHAMARRATEALAGPVELPGGQATLSASIGVALIQDDVIDGPEALRQSDLALYRAKAEGRGRFALFEREMDESLRLRRETEADLKAAIEADEIEIFYQPEFTARGGKLDNVEALARWTHPVRGPIAPAYFVPIAEESGLIHELGRIVMRRAFQDAQRWGQLKVAVNVSPVQLRQGDFVDVCRQLLRETGIDPARVELEITEGVLMDHDHRSQAALKDLRAMGFKLALDDFGTGYSSLSYLNAYPVDKIKIDRSFVSALGVQEDADKVVRAIVRLGKALGLQVTAEGVETEAQRNELVSAGCNLLQGYLEARPAEAAAIDKLVAEASGRTAA